MCRWTGEQERSNSSDDDSISENHYYTDGSLVSECIVRASTYQIVDCGCADSVDQVNRDVYKEHGENEGQHVGER